MSLKQGKESYEHKDVKEEGSCKYNWRDQPRRSNAAAESEGEVVITEMRFRLMKGNALKWNYCRWVKATSMSRSWWRVIRRWWLEDKRVVRTKNYARDRTLKINASILNGKQQGKSMWKPGGGLCSTDRESTCRICVTHSFTLSPWSYRWVESLGSLVEDAEDSATATWTAGQWVPLCLLREQLLNLKVYDKER